MSKKVLAVVLGLVCLAGCASGEVAQTPNSTSSSVAPAIPTFATDADWRANVQKAVPSIRGAWADSQVVPIGKAVCTDFDRQPRITAAVIDAAVAVYLNADQNPLSRDEALTFLKNATAQFCPTYNIALAEYR